MKEARYVFYVCVLENGLTAGGGRGRDKPHESGYMKNVSGKRTGKRNVNGVTGKEKKALTECPCPMRYY